MGVLAFLFAFLFALLFFPNPFWVSANDELRALLAVKAALDPENQYLSSWTINGDPCGGLFEGLACNEKNQVSNISLQGKGLSGKLSPSISELKNLTGLYLHYNSLVGEIPREIANLTELTDLYLNVNNLTGDIPSQIGNMASLQVLQLCYNQLSGSIPTQLGSMGRLSVLALQSNQLTGAIPASLGDLTSLMRLDLSSNHLFGSIPSRLADAPLLRVLDIRNNTLSGDIPPAFKRLNDGFLYANNLDLCGVGFLSLKVCSSLSNVNPNRPEPFYSSSGSSSSSTTAIPETANVHLPCNETKCSTQSKVHQASIIGVIMVAIVLLAAGILSYVHYRRRKQKLSTSFGMSDNRISTDQTKGIYRKNGSPLASLEYANGWNPLADGRNLSALAQEVFQTFRFNLDEIETATQYFSETNLLGKSKFSATYRGILRDGSLVAVKSINKTSCKADEGEFLKGLNLLTSLRHENLVRLRGFCCSRGRGECFLVYDFVPNGNLLKYLDGKDGDCHVLEWTTRISIIKGIAKGIAYLHRYEPTKPALVHQNMSAEKVLIDQRFNPLLSGSGLQKLLTNDVVYSELKSSAKLGYLAPEYTTTGKFTEKSDVYAFGVLVFQIISGTTKILNPPLHLESSRLNELIDPKLHGRFFEYEAAKLSKIALACTHESEIERPAMDSIVLELASFSSCH